MVVAVVEPVIGFPPGFPHSLARQLPLLDGRRVCVRPVLPRDQEALRWAIEQANAETCTGFFWVAVRPSATVRCSAWSASTTTDVWPSWPLPLTARGWASRGTTPWQGPKAPRSR